jgi:hypothetical protein
MYNFLFDILNFFNNITNDIFILYSTYVSSLINIISIGSMLLINLFTILTYYYNLTHGYDQYVRSTIKIILLFNFIGLVTTGITIYESNPHLFGITPTPIPTSIPTSTPTLTSTPTSTPTPIPTSTPISTSTPTSTPIPI